MTSTLEATGLVKRFGKTPALDGLNLTMQPGQVMALLGPNGAGKTTFVNLVATLLHPDAGTLRVDGIDVARQPAAVRRLVALAGQSAAVEPTMTGRENVDHGRPPLRRLRRQTPGATRRRSSSRWT